VTDADKPWRDEDRLRALYVDERLSTKEIGKKLDCSRKTVEKWIARYSLKTEAKPWRKRETLRRMREDEHMSQAEIADQFDCTQSIISYWLQKFDLYSGEVRKPDPWRDGTVLRELYVHQQLTMEDVSNTLECSRQAVEEWIHRHDIETRSRNPEVPCELTEKEELEDRYLTEKMSTYEIADSLGCAPSTVFDWIQEHGIETRSVGSQPGELHHRWQGGYDPYYGDNWHRQRRRALNRDGNKCQSCEIGSEKHRKKHGAGLDVHHIVPLREFDAPERANRLENLITLCRNCHNRLEDKPPETFEEIS